MSLSWCDALASIVIERHRDCAERRDQQDLVDGPAKVVDCDDAVAGRVSLISEVTHGHHSKNAQRNAQYSDTPLVLVALPLPSRPEKESHRSTHQQ